ncbi:hypothetical protein [Paenibacillus sp. L3-i20]|uniref:hypothetical protein n=1 Tax=Paenibacillus sp. L3-i20 TaxID=2905833 RepID=UPI001EDE01EB|nr:hypothetical protein [Paenibacillus sp. L3-i20]GKU79811.1 hypothetical protein L3i20_v242080 [Paenibacillus sp. L3-i20]
MSETITLNQIDEMKHCIGYDKKHVKRGKYRAYRNYFNNGDEQCPSWEELVSKGYAKQFKQFDAIIYCLTDAGKLLLEKILDVKITEMD